jgi:hypothetical protein
MKVFFLATSLLFCSIAYSVEPEKLPKNSESNSLSISLLTGLSRINIKPNYTLNGEDDRPSLFNIGLGLGYQFHKELQIEVEVNYHADFFSSFDDFTTTYDFREMSVGIAYPAKLGTISIIPKIGLSHWSYETNKKRLSQSMKDSDKDFFASLEFKLSDNGRSGISFRMSHMRGEFGDISTADLIITGAF